MSRFAYILGGCSGRAGILAAMTLLSGCVSFDPRYRQPELPVANNWPIAASTAAADSGVSAVDIGWRDFFVDTRLQRLVEAALQNNRDLRVAVLNIERARAQYRVQRADRVPSVSATGTMTRGRSYAVTRSADGQYPLGENYSAAVGVSAFEVDLFGRVRSLSKSALESYLSTVEARRSTQLSLIAEVANAYLTLAADSELQRLAEETLKNQEDSFRLTQQRYEQGAVSGLDLAQAQTTVESARADAAGYEGNVIKDTNALTLLVGMTLDPEWLPTDFEERVTGLQALPAGLPSEILLRRPDILEAEHNLRATNANIGAARAAFLPNITLTGSVGAASDDLSNLFDSANRTWSFVPQISVPIFQGGRLWANLGIANADRDIALAQYESAIQSGFREVADALGLTQTLTRQRAAQEKLVEAAHKSYQLSDERYRAGRDSYLVLLDAQRSEYSARQALISTRLTEQSNRVTLYKALGGGWRERSP